MNQSVSEWNSFEGGEEVYIHVSVEPSAYQVTAGPPQVIYF